MSNLPTITDVVTYLRGTGMEGMALAVENLERAYAAARPLNDTEPTNKPPQAEDG